MAVSNAVVSEGKIRALRWLVQVVQYLKKVDELSLRWYWF
jgi:hypothetical protein